MSRPNFYHWIASDPAAIAALQTVTVAPFNMVLNGTLSSFTAPAISSARTAKLPGLSRTVTLTSASNLSAVNFAITGLLNGTLVSEVIAGPNANTVQTTQIFQQILVITASGTTGASTVSAGTGQTGQTNYFGVDYNRSTTPITSMNIHVTGTITYEVHGVTGDPTTTESIDNVIGAPSAVSQPLVLEGSPSYYYLKITASTGAATLDVGITQQGLT